MKFLVSSPVFAFPVTMHVNGPSSVGASNQTPVCCYQEVEDATENAMTLELIELLRVNGQ